MLQTEINKLVLYSALYLILVISAVGISVPSIFCILNFYTDPGLLKIWHSHRFVAVVIHILIPFGGEKAECECQNRKS